MRIAGVEKCSFVDYPGRLAAVFFVPECNWDCYFCHNRNLVASDAPRISIDPEQALGLLRARVGMLDAVVITGGEPTLQPGLAPFIAKIRSLGFSVKLDTNGSRPQVLGALLDDGLLDFVAMDLKAPMSKYEAICGVPIDHNEINASIDLIMGSGVDYEFRTTVVPQLTHEDILKMARRIQGARRYVLQQYRTPDAAIGDPRLLEKPHPSDWVLPILDQLHTIVRTCDTRGFKKVAQAVA